MKKLIPLLVSLMAPVANANCNYEHVIDLNNWHQNYLVPEARMVYLVQILNGRYAVYDGYGIVVDLKGANASGMKYNDELYQLADYIGKIGEEEMTTVTGFSRTISMYKVITASDFYSCPNVQFGKK